MARVVRFHEIGGPEVLRLEKVEIPPLGKGEIQIRIHALGLNRAEVMFRTGQYVSQPKLPPARYPKVGRHRRLRRSA
jgi:NADPH:quinone reductase-like Zn-dependent oxidoreductase